MNCHSEAHHLIEMTIDKVDKLSKKLLMGEESQRKVGMQGNLRTSKNQ